MFTTKKDFENNTDMCKSAIESLHKSCGKCIPCREGTKRIIEILENFMLGEGQDSDVALIEEIAKTVYETALCGLGRATVKPLISMLEGTDETDAVNHEEPAFVIDPEKCRGCSLCARNCPVNAISGEIRSPYVINPEICVRCGACRANCKFGAIAICEE